MWSVQVLLATDVVETEARFWSIAGESPAHPFEALTDLKHWSSLNEASLMYVHLHLSWPILTRPYFFFTRSSCSPSIDHYIDPLIAHILARLPFTRFDYVLEKFHLIAFTLKHWQRWTKIAREREAKGKASWTLRPDYCKYLDKWNFAEKFIASISPHVPVSTHTCRGWWCSIGSRCFLERNLT